MINSLKLLFTKDLNRLRNEIELYKDEKNIWKTEKNISNSAGNLCLHLIGNLNTYIGKEIGNSGYVRNRDAEFSSKNVSRVILIDNIEKTIEQLNKALYVLDEEQMKTEYPILIFAEKTSIEYLLIHLYGHLTYHLGQINYHRRFVEE
jgi:uncharacterized damage-inducible protein DinB